MSEVMRIMQCEATPHKIKNVEMRGIEPRAFHMQSERSTTELHPPLDVPTSIFAPQSVYGHIMLKAPVLVRSLKLSNIESR